MRAIKIVAGFIFLLGGSYLYLKSRSETLLMFKWAQDLGVDFFVSAIRRSFGVLEFPKGKYIIFSVPYGMWVISFCCFIGAIWHKDSSLSAVIWRFIAPVIAISSEVLQFLGLLPALLLTMCYLQMLFIRHMTGTLLLQTLNTRIRS